MTDTFQEWVGRTDTQRDIARVSPANALAATLDRTDMQFQAGATLPPGWHWLYFLPAAAQSALGSDGHPRRGGFLPPVPLPRRMWAASKVEFIADVAMDSVMERTSKILSVEKKEGRSGTLWFVGVEHEIRVNGALAIREQQDIVYRDNAPSSPAQKTAKGEGTSAAAPPATSPASSEPPPTWQRIMHPDPTLLFRYSALTFNAHRIHYDQPYATKVEGYPGLVVHGPLQATLLLDLVSRNLPNARVKTFEFRARSPIFDTAPFVVNATLAGDEVKLSTTSVEGTVAMEARARLELAKP